MQKKQKLIIGENEVKKKERGIGTEKAKESARERVREREREGERKRTKEKRKRNYIRHPRIFLSPNKIQLSFHCRFKWTKAMNYE